jgi:hypothetical protein
MAEPSTAPAADPPRGISMQEAAALLDARQASGAYAPTRASAGPAGGATQPPDQTEELPDEAPSNRPTDPAPGKPDPDVPAPDDNVDQDGDEAEAPEPEDEDAEPEEEPEEAYIEDDEGNRVPVSEALNAYKRFKDLHGRVTKKEQALADEKRAFQGQLREVETALAQRARAVVEQEQANLQKAQQVDGFLAEIAQNLADGDKQFESVDWAKLKGENIGEYLVLSEEYRRHQDNKRLVDGERQRLAREHAQAEQRTQQQQYQRLQQHIQTNYADLISDPQKGQKVSDAMLGLARRLGYSDAEIQGTLDTRAWDMWKMAAEHELMMQERERALQGQPKRKLVENGELAPQRVKIVKPSAPKPRALTQERAQLGGAYSAFQKDPSRENALRALNARQRYDGARSR